MTIRYKCEECGAALNIKDELAGTKGNCPRCQVEFIVPAPEGGLVEQKAAGASAPAERPPRRPGEPLTEDDIGSFLAGGADEPRTDRHLSVDDDTDHDLDEEPSVKRGSSRLDEADEDDGEEDQVESPRKKKNRRAPKSAPAKGDSAESALIAKNLMARGEKAPPRDEKKGGRPFGGSESAREEEGEKFSVKEIVKYFVSLGWPFFVGIVAFFGLCFSIYWFLTPGPNLPPLARVSGTVMLDGAPLAKAKVMFLPILESTATAKLTTATASFAFTDDKGKFDLQYAYLDGNVIWGATLGKHMVTISLNDDDGREKIPVEYSTTQATVLKADVVKGMPPVIFQLSSSGEKAANK
jgi:hypothetical protein